MNSEDNDIDKLFKKFNINVIFKNNNVLKNKSLFAKTNAIKTNYVETFDNDKPIKGSIYPSNINYGKDGKKFINQPIRVKCSDQKMAGVVKHNIPCPPAQAISYTNFHIETSIEVVSNRVFVGGLTENIVEEDLNNFFQRYGKIQNSRIIKNSNNLSKGYGFVTFVDEASATRVKDLATSDPDTFCIQNCRITVKDARKKGVTKRVTHCAFPNFQVPSLIENSNQGISQQVYQNGEYQSPLSLQNDGSVAIQTGSHQQFLTPPQTPTNFTPSPPPSTFAPPFGYYQYPYQYPYNPYYQVNHPPYQVYQYTHVSHPQNHSYNLDDTTTGEYRGDYNGEFQQTPIVTIESDSEENS